MRPDPASAPAAWAAAVDPARESARRLVVRLVFLLVLLAIVEGAIRKWVAPQFGAYIFFLRDPFLVLAYAVATRNGLWPRGSLWLPLSVGMAALGVLLFVLQALSGGHSDHRLILGVYGWRAYFLYVPLAFLVGSTFRTEDLQRLFRLLLWLAIPIGLLVAAQFASPQGAPINVGSAEDRALQFRGLGLNAERTRPMGPFASGAGQQQFAAVVFALLLGFFVSPRQLPQPRLWVLMATGAGVLTCIALSGSRGLVLQCGVAVCVALALGLIGRGGALTARAFIWPALISTAALAAYPLVFPEGYAAFMERWTAADAAESRSFESTGVFGRALYGVVDFVRYLGDTPPFGYGLGYGGNAVITLGARIDGSAPPYAETDFARHMIDLGPLLGLGYIVFRLALLAHITQLAVAASRDRADPMPMLLWSYAAYVLLMGQLTGQGTINFFGWLVIGLLIAASKGSSSKALDFAASHAPDGATVGRRGLAPAARRGADAAPERMPSIPRPVIRPRGLHPQSRTIR